MGAVLWTIALVLAALGTALVALLFVPADFLVSARTGTGLRYRVHWLFGLVRVQGPRPRREPRRLESTQKQEVKRDKPRRKRRRRPRRFRGARAARGLLAIEGLIPRGARLVRDLIRSLGVRRGRIAVRAGTGDPADTGELCGLVGPLLVCLPRMRALRVEFEPDFAEAVFEAEAEGGGRFVPARLVGALGRFALSRPGRRAIKVLVWDARR